jgi:sporulation protein YlmC with PRC-barrel domain
MDAPPPVNPTPNVSGAMINDPAAVGVSATRRGTDFMGTEVVNSSYQTLGQLKDLIVDFSSGRVAFGILSTEKGRSIAVPASLLKPRSMEKEFALNIPQQNLNTAPDFAKSDLEDGAWSQQIQSFYGAATGQNYATAAPGQVISEAAGAQPEKLARLSDLTGIPVKDGQGEIAGEIKDVVLNWSSGQVDYAVLDSAGVADLGGKYIAIPLQDLSRSPAGGTLITTLSKEQMSGAPHFNAAHWPPPQDKAFLDQVNHFYHAIGQENKIESK